MLYFFELKRLGICFTIILTLIFNLSYGMDALQRDSLGIKQYDGEFFILHRIEKSQTLYAVSRKYKLHIKELIAANPDIDINNIKTGFIVRVPYKGTLSAENLKSMEISKLPQSTISSKPVYSNQKQDDKFNYHKVEKGQNLYRIALANQTTIANLQEMNNMNSSSIRVGQYLKVGYKENSSARKELVKPTDRKSLYPSKADNSNKRKTIKEAPKPKTNDNKPGVQTVYNGPNSKTKVENGDAGTFNDTYGSNQFTALHNSAPKGTVILVKNPKNSNIVYVKVSGSLPKNQENKELIIKLSKKSAEKLNVNLDKFQVELSYVL